MRTRGFTLVEILIVVVILGILAAIVIPQFTDASTEAKQSSLMSDLQTVRSQIQLYKIQHNDNFPGIAKGTHTATAGFKASLTGQTDVYGEVGTQFGPYVQQIPTNGFNNSRIVTEGALATPPGSATDGWYYNTSNGKFWANDNYDPNHLSL
jgi:general secretion pathway protein G